MIVKKPANNQIYLDDNGFIFVQWSGDQDGRDVKEVVEKIWKIIKKLQKEQKDIYILNDAIDAPGASLYARLQGANALVQLPFKKDAFYGGSYYISQMLNFMIRALNKQAMIRVFDSREEAVEWLKK